MFKCVPTDQTKVNVRLNIPPLPSPLKKTGFNLFSRFTVQAEVKVTTKEHIMELVNSETRIILLYTTKVV
jgi:hypothetical protein